VRPRGDEIFLVVRIEGRFCERNWRERGSRAIIQRPRGRVFCRRESRSHRRLKRVGVEFGVEDGGECARRYSWDICNARPFRALRWYRIFCNNSGRVRDRGSSEKSGSFPYPAAHFRECRLVLIYLGQGRCQNRIRLVILVAFPSVSALVCDNLTLGLHLATERKDG